MLVLEGCQASTKKDSGLAECQNTPQQTIAKVCLFKKLLPGCTAALWDRCEGERCWVGGWEWWGWGVVVGRGGLVGRGGGECVGWGRGLGVGGGRGGGGFGRWGEEGVLVVKRRGGFLSFWGGGG